MPRRQLLAQTRGPRRSPKAKGLPILLTATLLTVKINGTIAGAIIALAGVLAGLWIGGDRAERQRRRDLHARALAAILAYAEMPFMIRRRRYEPEHSSAERVRLAEHFSAVKAELTNCQVLLAADGAQRIATSYDALVEVAKSTAGIEAHDAWEAPPDHDRHRDEYGRPVRAYGGAVQAVGGLPWRPRPRDAAATHAAAQCLRRSRRRRTH